MQSYRPKEISIWVMLILAAALRATLLKKKVVIEYSHDVSKKVDSKFKQMRWALRNQALLQTNEAKSSSIYKDTK